MKRGKKAGSAEESLGKRRNHETSDEDEDEGEEVDADCPISQESSVILHR